MARKIMTPRRLHEQLQVKDDNLVDLVADMPRTSRYIYLYDTVTLQGSRRVGTRTSRKPYFTVGYLFSL